MKQLLLVLWLAMASLAAYSQEIHYVAFNKISVNEALYVNGVPFNALTNRYCEVSLAMWGFKPLFRCINIDFGQIYERAIVEHKQYYLATAAENTYVCVQTNVQLLDFMDKHGWKLVAPMPHTDSAGTRYSFLMERKTP